MALSVKRMLHIGGSILAITAIFFMVTRFYTSMEQMDLSTLLPAIWGYIFLVACFYGICNMSLVIIWVRCLEYLGLRPPFSSATYIYGFSQLGKYLPGNIFHLAGRQTLGMAENFPAAKLMQSMVWELGIIAVGAVGIFCPPFLAYYCFPAIPLEFLFLIFALCCIVVPYGAGRFFGDKIKSSILWCIAYLSSVGVAFVAVLLLVTHHPMGPVEIFFVANAYVAAWFIGFVTPGAPAGLGMREAAMIFLMQGMSIPEVDVLLAVALNRIVTILGDFLFFVESVGLRFLWLRNRSNCQQDAP